MDRVQGMYAKVAALRTSDARSAATLQKRATVCGSPFLFLFRLFGLLNNLNKNLSGAPTAIFTDDDELPWCAGRILFGSVTFYQFTCRTCLSPLENSVFCLALCGAEYQGIP